MPRRTRDRRKSPTKFSASLRYFAGTPVTPHSHHLTEDRMPPRKRTATSSKTAAKTAAKAVARPGRTSTVTASAYGQPELIVVADPAAALRIGTGGVESGGGADTRALNR